jgi:hypothetical protein
MGQVVGGNANPAGLLKNEMPQLVRRHPTFNQ